MTVKELKEYIKNLPEQDKDGYDYEVWCETKQGESVPVTEILPLNLRDNGGDILITIF